MSKTSKPIVVISDHTIKIDQTTLMEILIREFGIPKEATDISLLVDQDDHNINILGPVCDPEIEVFYRTATSGANNAIRTDYTGNSVTN